MSNASTLSVTFWGAARTVTGSMHLVEYQGQQILLDCGLFQGKRSESFQRNRQFPFSPRQIDAVVLSHAHIDHCGNLPNLVRQGFRGPIWCTPATADLMEIMLTDSAKIQEEDAAYLNRHRAPHPDPRPRGGRGDVRIEPLFQSDDVADTVRLARKVPYDVPQRISKDVELRFVDAGHLLGSAMVSLTFGEKSLTFTGDLGRRSLPILRDPAPVPPGDLLISECTYGGRTHPPVSELTDDLAKIVQRTSQRGGKLLIPAFALGRTQAVIYCLHQLIQAGRLPDLPIFVDSPLASNATEIFLLHPECFDPETLALLRQNPDIFAPKRVRYLRTVVDSKRLNEREGPAIIIAASGMCESGRILHHLKNHIEDARTTLLMIGYQAPDTLGRRILDRQSEVRILDGRYQVRAEVVALNGFSSHADHVDFLRCLGPLAGTTKKVRLVHGEEGPAESLAVALGQGRFQDVSIPARGERVEV